MNVADLKKYIYENNKIEYVLEQIQCHHIKFHPLKGYYSCGNYNGDNTAAINLKNNIHLNVVNYTREKEFGDGSDLITLVQYNKQYDFITAIKYLHEILGLQYSFERKPQKDEGKVDHLNVFTKHLSKKRIVDVGELDTLDEELLDDYMPLLHESWYREGIIPKTREKFGICYSYRRKRIIIPIRDWLTKELVGFNMRTTVVNYEMFNIPKYWITPTYQKSVNLYGLAENYDSIINKKIVTVFESEKSVLKRDSLLDDTCVALQGKTMSDVQAGILFRLNSEVVIAMDKDVCLNEVRHMCEKLYNKRPVSYIWDSWGLLEDKQSPADASNQIYQFLFKHRVKYDAKEHELYEKSLERKVK